MYMYIHPDRAIYELRPWYRRMLQALSLNQGASDQPCAIDAFRSPSLYAWCAAFDQASTGCLAERETMVEKVLHLHLCAGISAAEYRDVSITTAQWSLHSSSSSATARSTQEKFSHRFRKKLRCGCETSKVRHTHHPCNSARHEQRLNSTTHLPAIKPGSNAIQFQIDLQAIHSSSSSATKHVEVRSTM